MMNAIDGYLSLSTPAILSELDDFISIYLEWMQGVERDLDVASLLQSSVLF